MIWLPGSSRRLKPVTGAPFSGGRKLLTWYNNVKQWVTAPGISRTWVNLILGRAKKKNRKESWIVQASMICLFTISGELVDDPVPCCLSLVIHWPTIMSASLPFIRGWISNRFVNPWLKRHLSCLMLPDSSQATNFIDESEFLTWKRNHLINLVLIGPPNTGHSINGNAISKGPGGGKQH